MVTNKHVIEGAETARLRFVACEDDTMSAPLLGQAHHIDIQAPGTLFTGHPTGDVDVAVLPISPGVSRLKEHGQFVFFRAVTSAVSMDDASVQTLDAMEEVTFLGYPNGLYDQVNFLPIARRGHTATPPAVDYGGQPVFLVDASVFPGSSGSPVFLAQTGTYSIRNTGAYVGQRVMLLGVLAAVYQRTVPVLQVPTATASFVRDAIDIGIVYKARTINEAVDVALAPHGLKRSSEEPPDQVAQPSASQDPLSEQ